MTRPEFRQLKSQVSVSSNSKLTFLIALETVLGSQSPANHLFFVPVSNSTNILVIWLINVLFFCCSEIWKAQPFRKPRRDVTIAESFPLGFAGRK